ncbi:unnamed protein product [Pleuronectes platessa]|uniref:C2H2-type domain-containing protein n=1 Tax=Pleuronectes platessa TaxID=8262 RepID=A0A9N7V210_PLEPL|nr:unnamed protein product [Pleuronectes platessa]
MPSSALLQPSAPMPQKYALSDIADMVKVLPKATTPKPSVPSRIPTMKLESDVRRFEDVSSDMYSIHKRKGRQSNWNPSAPPHPAGPVRLQPLPDLRREVPAVGPRPPGADAHLQVHRVVHDHHKPLFRSPGGFISHLESHLGFLLKDMCKMPVEHQTKVDEPELSKVLGVRATEAQVTDEDVESKFKCKLCCRTFASNHAVKLHLSKTHSKSPDNHSQYVEMDRE